jgi:hypothetical protein
MIPYEINRKTFRKDHLSVQVDADVSTSGSQQKATFVSDAVS